ncbi:MULTISPECIES: uracil-DNA glycosylase [Cyanophyceae]|uniref:uracil-DNA glycosylase n=1 Tax=Cyanophyceae TaxID=3028117 RepID=UPI001681C4D6|nr:uracil-DNA glycosylase [Trichocoleus sp. FACHB-69]MBD1932341.1 uracil-DNA glycosylase [Trichocoleus sp. FACHB-69]
MKDKFHKFIKELSNFKSGNNVFNQYSYDFLVNEVRRDNLFLYLKHLAERNPQFLLVGEAPGHRGCRLTGVPFTSEFILLNGFDEIRLFGESRGYRKTNEFDRVYKEQSATIVWETLVKYQQIPLLWNAFPFHPFKVGNQQSNRTPTTEEINIGEYFLKELIILFDINSLVAVGNEAEKTLAKIGLAFQKVRHPANGGKNKFNNGIKNVMNTLI